MTRGEGHGGRERGGGDVPGLARALLRRVVPRSERAGVEGELAQGFRRRLERHGRVQARWWYRRQVWGFVWRTVRVHHWTDDEEGRGMMSWLTDAGSDIRLALRGFLRRPTYTAVVVATLALGVGANAAIFTLVDAHFFAPLPYEEPEEIVLLWETARGSQEVTTVAPGNYWVWREEARSFSEVAAFNVDFAVLSGDDTAERVSASYVVPHFFDVLGVPPLMGTGFQDAAAVGDLRQVLLSHSLWSRRYGADPGLVGRDIRVDGEPHTVVGIMPRDYRQPERSLSWQAPELWRPLALEGQRGNHGARYLRAVARLDEGVTVARAQEEMDAMASRMAEAFPEANGGRSILVRTLDDYLLSDARPVLLMLLLAGGAVLLIVCANVANLTLARGEERRGEFALRAALGSGRGRLVRQVVVEAAVLALAGGVVGTLGLVVGRDLLQSIQSRYFSNLVEVTVDPGVVAATLALALAAGVLFALPMAGMAGRPGLREAMVESGSRSGSGAASGRMRNALVVTQVGLATTLLVVAALLSRSFVSLTSVPPGFRSDGIAVFDARPPSADYPDPESRMAYHRELTEALRSVPGVREVAMSSDLMFTTENRFTTFSIDGRPSDPTRPFRAEYHTVSPEYFETLEIPLRQGVIPDPGRGDGELPIVISQRMAEEHWPGGGALGATLVLEWSTPRPMRVVGVVGDVLDDGYDADPEPVFYLPFERMPSLGMSYLVRAEAEVAALFPEIRAAVARVDADVPAAELRLLTGMMAETAARPRAASLIGGVFALLALVVAAVGIYGVLSYSVQLRTREIGIRAALGASGSTLLQMVLGHSLRLVVVGLGLGVAGALVAGRALSGLLFGVGAWDPASLVGSVVLLGSVALLAAWLPARRAVAIDPREALRSE